MLHAGMQPSAATSVVLGIVVGIVARYGSKSVQARQAAQVLHDMGVDFPLTCVNTPHDNPTRQATMDRPS